MAGPRTLFEDDAEADVLSFAKLPVDGELDITPLIDVVFLLLIFFMVSSTMQGTPDVDVPYAHYGTGVPSRAASVVTIRLNPSGTNSTPLILLGDGRGAEADLDSLRQYVEEGLRANRTHVIIKAERRVPHGFVQEVTRVVAAVPGIRFNVGVQEQPGSTHN